VNDDGTCTTGNPNVACAVPATGNGARLQVQPGGAGSACIFENLTSRFAVYQGAKPSTRGMAFAWQTTGGFTPLSMSLATQTSAVNPQAIDFIPELNLLAVIDGSTLGLTLFDLDSLGISLPSPYF